MAVMRIENIPQEVADLIGDAADREGMKKHAFVKRLLERAASKEYAKQQQDDARTANEQV